MCRIILTCLINFYIYNGHVGQDSTFLVDYIYKTCCWNRVLKPFDTDQYISNYNRYTEFQILVTIRCQAIYILNFQTRIAIYVLF